MSWNSTNRFSTLSAELTEARYANRETEYDRSRRLVEEQNNLEEACSFLESVELSEDYTFMLESPIIASEMDNEMISSFIESEFMIAMDEFMDVIKESKEVSSTKIKANTKSSILIDKTTYGIINSSKKLVDKITELLSADKKIYDKYIVALKKPNCLNGFKGISSINIPTKEIGDNISKIVDVNELNDLYKSLSTKLLKADSEYEVDEAVNEYKESIKSLEESYRECEKNALVEKTDWVPNNTELRMLYTFIDGNAVKKAISYHAKKVTDVLSKIEKEAKATYLDLSANERYDSLELYKANALYNCTSLLTRTALNKYSMYRDLTIRQVAAMRKAFIICGKYANSVLYNRNMDIDEQYLFEEMLTDASDTYVFESLSEY